jgi:hypothetical protein
LHGNVAQALAREKTFTEKSLAEKRLTYELLVGDATSHSDDTVLSLGSTAKLSEEGYQRVVALRSNDEMKAFIRRVLSSEAREVKDESGLSGIVPFYSGVEGKRDLLSLKQELRTAIWVGGGEGRTAPLSEEGYQRVAALKNMGQMKAFMRRIIAADGNAVTDEAGLSGVAPFYSGQVAMQSFEALQKDTRAATWVMPLKEFRKAERTWGGTAPLSEEGYQRVAEMKSDKEMTDFVNRVIASEARWVKDEAGLNGLVPYYSGTRGVRNLDSLRAELRSDASAGWVGLGVGKVAPLTEEGYQLVAEKKSTPQMKAFLRRMIKGMALKISDEGGLNGMVPFYSGLVGVQSFEHATTELRSAPWLTVAEV